MRIWIIGALLLSGCAHKALDFREVVNSAKDKVFPAVVYIKCIRKDLESGRESYQAVTGSGVIISSRGEVLTNWHVVDKAKEVRCLLSDGQPFDAEILGSDKDTDLALLQLKQTDPPTQFEHANLGESGSIREGDFVMAMGAPWGLSRSVSMGIIASSSRFLEDHSEYSLWLQTDASISPGNSGGPLVNTRGEVIGINTRGYMQGGDLGFAVPSNMVRIIMSQIREAGKVNWSWTGLELQALRDFNKNIYFDATDGVVIAEVKPDSPATQAGLQEGDRILRINGEPVNGVFEEELPAIRTLLGLLPKGKPATIEYIRNEKTSQVEITPREKGDVEGKELDCPRWDLTIKSINQFEKPNLYFYRKEGIYIFGIKYPGNASNSNLQKDDIILKLGGKRIRTLDDVSGAHKEAIDNVSNKHKILITVLRGGLMKQVVLDFSRDYSKE